MRAALSAISVTSLWLLSSAHAASDDPRGFMVPVFPLPSSAARIGHAKVTVFLNKLTQSPLFVLPIDRVPIAGPLDTFDDATSAALAFVGQHSAFLGATPADFFPPRGGSWGKGWVVNFEQQYENAPIFGSHLSLLISHRKQLVYLTARVYPSSMLGGLDVQPVLDADRVGAFAVQAHGASEVQGQPRPTIAFRSQGPVLAWEVLLVDRRGPIARLFHYLIDDRTVEVLAASDLTPSVDVQGYVRGYGTTLEGPNSLRPDLPDSNPPVEQPLRKLTVTMIGGGSGSTETDETGHFLISEVPETTVFLRASLDSPLFQVYNCETEDGEENCTGEEVSETLYGLSTSQFDFLLNPSPEEFTTAQVNAFIWTERSRRYATELYERNSLNVTLMSLSVKTNIDIPCEDNEGGNYQASSEQYAIVFYRSRDACPNSCYSTIIAHEFGHHFCREIQGEVSTYGWGFGNIEGVSDTFAVYLTAQPVLGQEFFGPGTWVRHLEDDAQVFPTESNEPYVYGCLTLASGFWSLRLNLLDQDPAEGAQVAENLFTKYVAQWQGELIPSLDESVGDKLIAIDHDLYGDGDTDDYPHKNAIVQAFRPRNLFLQPFIRGDVNGDKTVDIADFIVLGQYLLSQQPVPGCMDAADINNDNNVNDLDFIDLKNYLFEGGSPPAPPFPACGKDEVSDRGQVLDHLTCIQSPCSP